MKVALLFSGRIDRFDEHYQNIWHQIVQNHDADVFLSTVADQEKIDRFCDLYHPKRIVHETIQYEPWFESTHPLAHPLANYHHMMCMYCHRYRVFQAMEAYAQEECTHYDMVVSLRLDAYHDDAIDYKRLDPAMEGIWIPEGYDWGGINDQMAIGNTASMKVYMNVWENIQHWISQPNFGPEIVLGQHLAHTEVQVHRFKHSYRLINGKYYIPST